MQRYSYAPKPDREADRDATQHFFTEMDAFDVLPWLTVRVGGQVHRATAWRSLEQLAAVLAFYGCDRRRVRTRFETLRQNRIET